jgi:DNA-binding CsgD family transcriptional regulator
MVWALGSLSDAGEGRFASADAQLRQAEELLTAGPWVEACQLLFTMRVIRLHAEGRPSEQRQLLPSLRGTAFYPVPMTYTDPLTVVHATLAAVWAQDHALAGQLITRLATLPSVAGWSPSVQHWLSALVAELGGRTLAALTLLNAAVADQTDDLPLYRAHMLLDQARVAELLGERAVATAALQRAEQLYRGLGAAPYLERLSTRRTRSSVAPGPQELRIILTDREKDVLALLVVGKSYAQIARELFITQKTVSYHLGNVYAKTGISSRHRLAEFIRAEPHAFGSITAAS